MDVSANLMKLQRPRLESTNVTRSNESDEAVADLEENDEFDEILIAFTGENLSSPLPSSGIHEVESPSQFGVSQAVETLELQDPSDSFQMAPEQVAFVESTDANGHELLDDSHSSVPSEADVVPLRADEFSESLKVDSSDLDTHQTSTMVDDQVIEESIPEEAPNETVPETTVSSDINSVEESGAELDVDPDQPDLKRDEASQLDVNATEDAGSHPSTQESATVHSNQTSSQRTMNPQRVASAMISEAINHSGELKTHSEVEFSMRLDPPELGEVIVRMRRSERKIVMTVQALDPETQTLIDENFGQLRGHLNEHDAQIDFQQSPNQSDSDPSDKMFRQSVRMRSSTSHESSERNRVSASTPLTGDFDFRA